MSALDAELQKIVKSCKDLSKKKVYVGIVGGADSESLLVASVHEYGSSRHPERSYIRASFDSHQGEITDIAEKQIINVLGGGSADGALNAIGAQCAQITQNFIDTNQVTPPSNYERKTQFTTLYETGTHIRDRITWKVE